MEAGTGNRAVPYWRGLYEAAVLELGPDKLNQSVEAAETAIRKRIEDLNPLNNTGEAEQLMNALTLLGVFAA